MIQMKDTNVSFQIPSRLNKLIESLQFFVISPRCLEITIPYFEEIQKEPAGSFYAGERIRTLVGTKPHGP